MKRIDFDHLFSALPSPHMILDRELRFVTVNPAYEAAVMRGRDELVGRGLFEMFPNAGEAGERLLQSLRRVLETGERDTLAYVRYEIPRPEEAGGGFEERYWTAIHSPLLDEEGDVLFILQNTVDITELVRLREAAAVPFRIFPAEVELVQRAREAEEAYSATRTEGADFRRMFHQAPGMVAVLQGPQLVFTFVNEAYQRFIGERQVAGLPIRDALPELGGQGFFEKLDAVVETGDVVGGESARVLVRRSPGEPLEEAFMDFSFHPIRDAEGAVTGIFFQGNDRTESVRASQRQRLLIDELNHRVKNTLATVQSIARQSFRDAQGPEAGRQAFEARILALSNAHNLLSDRHWESADLAEILRQELAPFDPARVRVSGPPVRLAPKATIALAMVMHELASNAVKYGALATPDGSLAVRWRRSAPAEGEARLLLEWGEGCRLGRDAHLTQGFGIKMLMRIVEGELDGSLDMRLGGTGLECRIDVPVKEVEDVAVEGAA